MCNNVPSSILLFFCFSAYPCFLFVFFFLTAQYWQGQNKTSLSFLKGHEGEVRCFTGHDDNDDNDDEHEPEFPSHKLPKKPKPTRVHRTDNDAESDSFNFFSVGESKPGPSLLNQLMPGQAFDPRQIDFSALTLPNSHRSTKNKKR